MLTHNPPLFPPPFSLSPIFWNETLSYFKWIVTYFSQNTCTQLVYKTDKKKLIYTYIYTHTVNVYTSSNFKFKCSNQCCTDLQCTCTHTFAITGVHCTNVCTCTCISKYCLYGLTMIFFIYMYNLHMYKRKQEYTLKSIAFLRVKFQPTTQCVQL